MCRKSVARCAILLLLAGCAHQRPALPPAAETPPATQPPAAVAPTPAATNPLPSPPSGAESVPASPATPPSPAGRPAPRPAASSTAATTARNSAGPPTTAAAGAAAAAATAVAPSATTSAPQPAAAGHRDTPAPPALDLTSLEQRLRDTRAIGVFTKLSLKNQVDDLLAQFKAFHAGQTTVTLAQLRQRFELLLVKVVTLLQDGDGQLAAAVSSSRDAMWAVLVDPVKFAQI